MERGPRTPGEPWAGESPLPQSQRALGARRFAFGWPGGTSGLGLARELLNRLKHQELPTSLHPPTSNAALVSLLSGILLSCVAPVLAPHRTSHKLAGQGRREASRRRTICTWPSASSFLGTGIGSGERYDVTRGENDCKSGTVILVLGFTPCGFSTFLLSAPMANSKSARGAGTVAPGAALKQGPQHRTNSAPKKKFYGHTII
jgi:hypothetical protein